MPNTIYSLPDYVSVADFDGETILKVEPEALTLLAQQAFHDASFMLRPAHQKQVAAILHDPEASENDKYVALQLLRNSEIAAKGVLPTCRITGTAIIVGKKGQRVWTGGGDEETLSKGVYNTYIEDNLRYSQNAALDMYKEVNTGTNLPAQIDLYAVDGDEYKLPCVAKGGGSANKTYLYQEPKALLTPGKLKNFLVEKIIFLGTAACPPYHIAFVIGGTSAETDLKIVKLARALTITMNCNRKGTNMVRRSAMSSWNRNCWKRPRNSVFSAPFGGKYFAHDIRVIRLPRHGASCPVGMGVSCSADRNIKAKIDREGIWIEKLEHNPGQYIPQELRQAGEGEAVKVDLNRPMKKNPRPAFAIPGIHSFVAHRHHYRGRDIAHAKLKELIDAGKELPQYIKDHPIYYAGPAKTPAGYPSGSLGPQPPQAVWTPTWICCDPTAAA